MKLFHGTNKSSAIRIIGPPTKIDVTKGGGELGRGFYLTDNVALAASLSKGKFATDGVVIESVIKNKHFVKLDILVLKKRKSIYKIWKKLYAKKTSRNHIFNVDVVSAPFATIDFAFQLKFESKKAENILNKKTKHKLL